MFQENYYFAVDLGATSGRTLLASIKDGKMTYEELTRFENNIIQTCGHHYWDIYALYNEIVSALKLTVKRGIEIQSIGIDTWGVDFVCVGKDGAFLRNPLCYRDPHTENIMEDYFANVIEKKTVFSITGIQFMNFNSLFQLYAMRKNYDSALENAESILFIPDALSYMLTGEKVCEYTIASTSQLLNPKTGDFDETLLGSVGLKLSQFGRMVQPGSVVGVLTDEVQRITGLGAIPVVAVAGHDTGSAVAAVPAKDANFAYLSSGTWSLMGIESEEAIINDRSYELNFTNEGGIGGTTRFLKNITGMWIYERCRKEWTDAPDSHAELLKEAFQQPPFRCFINPDDVMFANPTSMVKAIQDYCKKTEQYVPIGYAEMCRCIFESLALRYRQVFTYLKEFATFPIDVLHIIGGGCKNEYLNQFTADSLGVKVIAGPQECTAIGNIMLQAKSVGVVNSMQEMRQIIAESVTTKEYYPMDRALWVEAFYNYNNVINKNN